MLQCTFVSWVIVETFWYVGFACLLDSFHFYFEICYVLSLVFKQACTLKSWTCLAMWSLYWNEVFCVFLKCLKLNFFYQLLKDLEVLMKNVSTYFVLHFDHLHLTFLIQCFRRLPIHKNLGVDETRKWWGKKGNINL